MIQNGGAERSMEYDTVSVKYADFVEAEVLPRAEKEANVKLTKDPEGRMTFGGSSGGAVACQHDGGVVQTRALPSRADILRDIHRSAART